MSKTRSNFQDKIVEAVHVLRRGGVIVYPTDTIWGIGCDANQVEAVHKVNRIKGRKKDKKLLLLVSDYEMLMEYVSDVPAIAMDFLQSQEPTTIIYPNSRNIHEELLAEDGSIAIRIVQNKICSEMISLLGKPVTSTSANVSGEPPPVFFKDIDRNLLRKADFYFEAHFEEKNSEQKKASAIIKLISETEYVRLR